MNTLVRFSLIILTAVAVSQSTELRAQTSSQIKDLIKEMEWIRYNLDNRRYARAAERRKAEEVFKNYLLNLPLDRDLAIRCRDGQETLEGVSVTERLRHVTNVRLNYGKIQYARNLKRLK